MDDRQLIIQILEQNDQAFSILVDKYKRLVYAAIFRLVRDGNDAEDIFQDVFLEVYRSIHYLRNESDLAAWLFKISYNKSISFLRKKNPAKASALEVDKQECCAGIHAKHWVDQDTPALKMEEREAEFLLYLAIDRLPEMQKRVLLMNKFEGYSHKEISDLTDLTIASVESLIYRAKKSLRKSLCTYFRNNLK